MHLGAHRPVQMEVIDLLIGVLCDADSQKFLFVRDICTLQFHQVIDLYQIEASIYVQE